MLVQPVGAIEQHGPHLPLATDAIIAEAVAAAAVARVAGEGAGSAGAGGGATVDAWLLPTLSYSKSNEHAWAAGTVWLSDATMRGVLDDIGRSVAATPTDRLVFLNGHGGNSALLGVANRELRLKYGLRTFTAHPHMPADQGGASAASELGMGIHAGHDETSVMLHLAPELVDMSRAIRRVPEGLARYRHVRFGGSVSFGWLSNDFFPEGHIGDPTGASAEEGRRMFDAAVTQFAEALVEIAAFDFGR